MEYQVKVLATIRKHLFGRFPTTTHGKLNVACKVTPQDGNDLIKDKLNLQEPLLVSRLGSAELQCLMNYLSIKKYSNSSFLRRALAAIADPFPSFWDAKIKNNITRNAGFFPLEEQHLDRFAQLYLNCLASIDIFGCWNKIGELNLRTDYFPKAELVPLTSIEPYYHSSPWSASLQGRKVLVVHPFEKSIIRNYKNRRKIFSKEILPDFELLTFRAIQSIGGNSSSFRNWFEALDYMNDSILKLDFDVAIVGCGAYGLPLAAQIKSTGKQAIHMGGATQLLFGIMGKRWDNNAFFEAIRTEAWTRPLPEETPQGHKFVENGCYW